MSDASPLSDEQVLQFHDQGCLILPGFFSPEEVGPMDALIEDCLTRWDEMRGGESIEYRQRFDVHLKALPVTRDPAFRALFDLPDMTHATTQLLGEDHRRLYGFAFGTPRDGGQGWHKDSSDAAPGAFTLNRLVYTRDYAPEQGKLYILPGSHRYFGFQSDGPNHADFPGQLAVTPTAGMVAFVSSHCAHRVGLNATDEVRVVLNSRVNPAGVPDTLCDLPIFRSGRWRHSTQTFLG